MDVCPCVPGLGGPVWALLGFMNFGLCYVCVSALVGRGSESGFGSDHMLVYTLLMLS